MNQTIKADAGKWRMTIVPRQIVKDISEVREYGINKYKDPDNWKLVEIDRYKDALVRHLFAFLDDANSKDDESGIEHYKHMAANIAFICELMKPAEEEHASCTITDCFYNNDTICGTVGTGHYDCPNMWRD